MNSLNFIQVRALDRPVVALLLLLLTPAASAHSFGRVYNLPVPFWLYAWGAVAALAASFVVVGYFVSAGTHAQTRWQRDLTASPFVAWTRRLRLLRVLQTLSVAALLLCLLAGFAGSQNAYRNINMTLFWIVFVLGFAYLTAVAGDLYARINPWRLLAVGLGKFLRRYPQGLFQYPRSLNYWPAVLLYMAFIWVELFARVGPWGLSLALAVYTAINLIGVGLVGLRDWFHYCEFFSVFLRLIARMAPLEFVPGDGQHGSRLRLRAPFSGVLDAPAENFGLLVFVLFMLSSTAFDGLRETVVWQKIFWLDLYKDWLSEWAGKNPLAAYPLMRQIFLGWQTFWLVASPFVYLAIYLFFIWLTQKATRSEKSLRLLALEFALPLLPIALVYNITHYYTLIQTQGLQVIRLLSDPLGKGWNLFGTGQWLLRGNIPDAGTVWHVQVVLIVLGHIVSVYLAHKVALRVFPTQRAAVISQIPMLFLMMFFTTAGLWILSQPLQSA